MSSPIDEIKSRVDIAELVGSYVRLQKAGANLKAPCPFHNEKTPSFVVSPARQIWHCFGCGKGGDIFKFVMEIEGQEFPEALKTLADRAGVVLKREDPRVRSERNALVALMEAAAEFFQNTLKTENSVLGYLKKRGLKEETMSEFRIGFAPNEWQALVTHLRGLGFLNAAMERAGLAVRHNPSSASHAKEARYYDRFRGRIIFPIFDYQGRVVAFGGRIFEDAGAAPSQNPVAKYINSPETPLYQKSKILYGLYKAKTEILKSGSCIVVEGYMDMLMAYQAGTKNVVASSGTALTNEQVKMVRRLCDTMIASFDMDIAGQAAAKRGIELALGEGFHVKVIKLEGAKDPAEAVEKDPAVWCRAVTDARHIVQFYIDTALQKYSAEAPEGKREFEKEVLPMVALLSSELERAHWVRELAKLLKIQEESIWHVLRKAKSVSGTADTMEENSLSQRRTRKELLEERMLGILARSPHLFQRSDVVLEESFFSGSRVAIFAELKSGKTSFEGAAKELTDRMALESELFLERMTDAENEFARLGQELEKEHVKDRMSALEAKIRSEQTNKHDGNDSLMIEFQALSRRLSKLL